MNVLIVDDDDIIVEVIKDSVRWEKLGITEVYTAYDAEVARSILKSNGIDLVISDIEMPRKSGLDLLQWYQENIHSGKFILLTCHESFSYAKKALELQAADYMLKPFNVEAMELVLKKNINILEKERKSEQRAIYGQWVMDNIDELKLHFFESLINGKIVNDRKTIEENIRIRNLNLDINQSYRIVVSKVTNTEHDSEQYGDATLMFMLQNLHSESLCGMAVNGRVICHGRDSEYLLISVCDDMPEDEILERCRTVVRRSGEILEASITSCIGLSCTMEQFRERSIRLAECIDQNIAFYGQPFLEAEIQTRTDEIDTVLDMNKMKRLLDAREQKTLMVYLKKELEARIQQKTLDERTLKLMQLEFRQAVYGYLTEYGILVTKLFNDAAAMKIEDRARQSGRDLLRWANYMLGQAFYYQSEMQQQQSLIVRINAYIQEHYREKIGRNEIGAEFHMVPEYLAKMYKKKTGKTLKEYINECRIGQATKLLRDTDQKIIDIAMETGFDNISYFSTLFKKCTGFSPNDYRRN